MSATHALSLIAQATQEADEIAEIDRAAMLTEAAKVEALLDLAAAVRMHAVLTATQTPTADQVEEISRLTGGNDEPEANGPSWPESHRGITRYTGGEMVYSCSCHETFLSEVAMYRHLREQA